MQGILNAFEIKRSATQSNHVYVQTAIPKPQGNHKPENL